MNIVLNGEQKDVDAENVADVLNELGFGGATVATALNETFVPVGLRETTNLKEGDRLEVLAPMQGG